MFSDAALLRVWSQPLIPLDELRVQLLKRQNSRSLQDAVWAELVRRTQVQPEPLAYRIHRTLVVISGMHGALTKGFAWVKSHAFRKTAATVLDEAGLSALVIADQLGHARPSLTQDTYMGRAAVMSATALALEGLFQPENSDSIPGVNRGDDHVTQGGHAADLGSSAPDGTRTRT